MSPLSRRDALRGLLAGGCAACLARAFFATPALAQDAAQGKPLAEMSRVPVTATPARWCKKVDEGWIECGLCPRKCKVSEAERGSCGVRENFGGEYKTLVHSRVTALHIDPVEKKPFYHVLPGTEALSLAAPGCNFECKFCQNWEIAQVRPEQVDTHPFSPTELVMLAQERRTPSIACTYTEPVVWAEYVYDIAAASKKAGIKTLMVSNGFIEAEPMTDLAGVLGAMKVDLKGFTEKFYADYCGGKLEPVLKTLRLLAKQKLWTEIVTLLIPGLNDAEAECRAMARFVRDEVSPDTPLHFTRFHPSYRLMNLPPTPVATLERARDAALAEGLRFVYLGNVPGHPGNHTYCPGCGALLIRRTGLLVTKNRLAHGACPDCHRPIPGLW